MRKLMLVTFVVLLALAAAACSGGDDDAEGAGASAEMDAGALGAPAEEAVADEGGDAVAVAQPSQGGSLPSSGPRVIQTASLVLSVPRNEFQETIDSARTIALGLGGFVVGSGASQGKDGRLVRGSLVLRVPERSYARAMERLADLGRVEGREETGQDVSQELVDLESRARHLEAVESQLLELLQRADDVPAALAVQSQLNQTQLELEQVRGRLRHLDDQVAYATISLNVHERQVAAATDGGGGWGIVDAWRDAAHGFVTVVGWMLVAAATIAPVVLLLVVLFLAARIAARRTGVLARRGGERPSA